MERTAGAKRKKKKKQSLEPERFEECRRKWPPLEPKTCCTEFKERRANPKSGREVEQTYWTTDDARSGTDEGTYKFARELAKAGIFVDIVYTTVKHAYYINAYAGTGTAGQSVVHMYDHGTILWTSARRVYSPNAKPPLQAQLRVIFEPFDARKEARRTFDVEGDEESDGHTVESLDFDAEGN